MAFASRCCESGPTLRSVPAPANSRSREGTAAGPNVSNAADDDDDDHTWPGRRRGPVRGGLFLNNRYLDPTLGTFVSVDPLVVSTGEPYTYGNANPITYSDPWGLFSCYVPDNPLACLDISAMVREEGTNQKIPLDYATKMKVEVIWPSTHAVIEEWDWSPIAGTTIVPVPELAGDPFAWFFGELEGGWHQLMDPVTCGLRGINPVTGQVGDCSRGQTERRETYREVGEAVCEASRTPIVGSVIPEADLGSVGWAGVGFVVSDALKQSARAGSSVAAAGSGVLSDVNAVATAVDATCRWGTP